ncbi:MAG: P-loop NTPase, partial [bacterium]
ENMSTLICPHCKTEINLFKSGGGEKISNKYNIEFLGRIPIEPGIVELSDNGKPFIYFLKDSQSGKVMMNIVKRVMEKLENKGETYEKIY